MNGSVCLSRNPSREIVIFLPSTIGFASSSNRPDTYSMTTSSSKPSRSMVFFAIQGFMTDSSTLRMSTLVLSSGGNFIVLKSFFSLSPNRMSWLAEVPLNESMADTLFDETALTTAPLFCR